jgi:hypothetical protein
MSDGAVIPRVDFEARDDFLVGRVRGREENLVEVV